MNLQLAIAISEPITSGAQPASRVLYLDHRASQTVPYSSPMVERNIYAVPGDLVAVDSCGNPPHIVFRWSRMRVKSIDGESISTDWPEGYHCGLRLPPGLPFTLAPGDWVFAAIGDVSDVCLTGLPAHPEYLKLKYTPLIEDMYQQFAIQASLDPRRVVAQGYDQIAHEHLEWAQSVRSEERERYTSLLIERIPGGARVLDLGCGAGIPTTERLAQHFEVTGVDISAGQIELARQNVPSAQFVVADMTRVDFAAASFDAVAAFYSLIHVPRDEYDSLFMKIGNWLSPGGLFVASLGSAAIQDDYASDFMGARMYWSSFDPPTHRRLIENAGFAILSDRLETQPEFNQPVTFQWIVAQKPA